MEAIEIIKESFAYPLNNLAGLAIYMLFAIITAVILGLTGASSIIASNGNGFAGVGAIIGLIVSIILLLAIDGYALDIVKLGINRSSEAPGIDILRQATSGLKLFIVQVVYLIIPFIVYFLLLLILSYWLATLIFMILVIVFMLAQTMAQCRLAETDAIEPALNFSEAIADISRVGLGNILITVGGLCLIMFVIFFIIALIFGTNSVVGTAINFVISVYFLFVMNRSVGLLYSYV